MKNTYLLRRDKRKSVFFISFNCPILKSFSILVHPFAIMYPVKNKRDCCLVGSYCLHQCTFCTVSQCCMVINCWSARQKFILNFNYYPTPSLSNVYRQGQLFTNLPCFSMYGYFVYLPLTLSSLKFSLEGGVHNCSSVRGGVCVSWAVIFSFVLSSRWLTSCVGQSGGGACNSTTIF